jgi:hypothetical protein
LAGTIRPRLDQLEIAMIPAVISLRKFPFIGDPQAFEQLP